jgi:lipoprotein-releasing system permease protein
MLLKIKSFIDQVSVFEFFVGMRYTRAKRKNHFISFISLTSMIGIALGVAALIVVLSVMNGFQKDLRTRILGVASHLEITGNNNALEDWTSIAALSSKREHVLASAPYITAQAMLSYGQGVQGAIIRGILPAAEEKVADLGKSMKVGALNDLRAGEFGIILGTDLAYNLGAQIGDKVVVMAPQGQFTPAGVVPRLKQFTVIGLFSSGMQEYDAGLALIHIDDAAKLYRMENRVSGVRLKLDDLFLAPKISAELGENLNQTAISHETKDSTTGDIVQNVIGGKYYVTDWTQQHANFFKAVQMEKRVMFIILTLIVAVAAFNIVSTLVMAVTDKRSDIAIMRTFGASPASIMTIFIIQGALIGIIGTLIGATFGVMVALNIDVIIPFIESLFHIQFLAKDVYQISEVPSDLIFSDVIAIVIVSIILSLLATLYPSWRASQINPAEALRYE